jgi:hypothetical protein
LTPCQVHHLVGGGHHHASSDKVVTDQPLHQRDRVHVQPGEGFVQYPQAGASEQQRGQSDAAALAERQRSARQVQAAGQAQAFERRHRWALFEGPVVQGAVKAQVLQGLSSSLMPLACPRYAISR